jgi:hypothetical protein
MNNTTASDPSAQALPLLPHHLHQLTDASGISLELITAQQDGAGEVRP